MNINTYLQVQWRITLSLQPLDADAQLISVLLGSFIQLASAGCQSHRGEMCVQVCVSVVEDIDETVRNRVGHVHRFFLSLFFLLHFYSRSSSLRS